MTYWRVEVETQNPFCFFACTFDNELASRFFYKVHAATMPECDGARPRLQMMQVAEGQGRVGLECYPMPSLRRLMAMGLILEKIDSMIRLGVTEAYVDEFLRMKAAEADRPHADGDFSRQCSNPNCRCHQ